MSPVAPDVGAGCVRVDVLGTAQDGGVPHAGCACPTCEAAHRDPRTRRRVASLAVRGPAGRTLVVDATPDFPAQAARLVALGVPAPGFDALLLTHAHIGHYLGLAWLGREAMNVRGLPVYVTPRMASFLSSNRPWAHLVDRGQVELHEVEPEVPLAFDGCEIVPFLSPHRAEDTDTIGVEVRAGGGRLLYVPDADAFPDPLAARIREVDVALVDGTFYDAKELSGRSVAEVPHPLVCESVEVLAGARGEIRFTHLNHTNALLHPDPSRRPGLPPGFGVLEDGAEFEFSA